jgi:ABC-type antimicrobial peptide transport system permease subunit
MVACGLGLGVIGVVTLGGAIESQLVGRTAINVPALLLAAAALLVAGIAACLAPAARAVGINPVDALKAE